MDDVETVYIAASANRASFIADTGHLPNGRPILAFASHKSVAVWEQPLDGAHSGASALIRTGFSTEITALRAVASSTGTTTTSHGPLQQWQGLIAGSRSGELAIVYPVQDASSGSGSGRAVSGWRVMPWTSASAQEAGKAHTHTATITTIGSIQESGVSDGSSFLVVTGSADGHVHISRLARGSASSPSTSSDFTPWSVTHLQTISPTELKGALPLCVQLVTLPSSSSSSQEGGGQPAYLLALALTKTNIQLYTCEPSPSASQDAGPRFTLALQLSGHEDWVRTLSFATVSSEEILLASGGQDNYVRLWRIARHAPSSSSSQMTAAAKGTSTTSQQGKPKDSDDDYIEKLMRKIELGDEHEPDEPAGSGNIVPSSSSSTTTTQTLPPNGRAFTTGGGGSGAGSTRSTWVVTMDALLVGHDGWITSVRWHPALRLPPPHSQREGDTHAPSYHQPAALLSTSADNSTIIWTPASTTSSSTSPPSLTSLSATQTPYVDLSSQAAAASIWAPHQRFGEIGGGSSLGFYGGLWVGRRSSSSPSSSSPSSFGVFCHAFNGATRLWAPVPSSTSSSLWTPRPAITGHLGPCKSLAWDPTGCMLLSSGSDRTTRLHARFRSQPSAIDNEGSSSPSATSPSATTSTAKYSYTWHELARPQTHGYDLHSVAWLDSWTFASAADEKVVRVFAAPASFARSLVRGGGLEGVHVGGGGGGGGEEEGQGEGEGGAGVQVTMPESAPLGACVPPLGLSNRAIFSPADADVASGPNQPNDDQADKQSESGQPPNGGTTTTTSVAGVFTSPPNEDELHVSTLWPEVDKLYGHGYELLAVGTSCPTPSSPSSSSAARRLVASSCKATNPEHAVIRIHDGEQGWKEVAQLQGHKLSVTRIRFHPGTPVAERAAWGGGGGGGGGSGSVREARAVEPNRFVLSAGRDRSWHIHELISTPSSPSPSPSQGSAPHHPRWRTTAVPAASSPQAHARIVWDCAWSADGSMFATASRDRTVKVWRFEVEVLDGSDHDHEDDHEDAGQDGHEHEHEYEHDANPNPNPNAKAKANVTVTLLDTLKLDAPCTSVAFGPRACLAVGTERGSIELFSFRPLSRARGGGGGGGGVDAGEREREGAGAGLGQGEGEGEGEDGPRWVPLDVPKTGEGPSSLSLLRDAHSEAVHELAFRPRPGRHADGTGAAGGAGAADGATTTAAVYLASGAEDGCVRIFRLVGVGAV